MTMKKEDVGHALKTAARILPGIGSYQDRESSREADKALRMELSERLDQLLGRAEWLKTDLARKRAITHIQRIEDVTRQLEKVSRMLEFAPRGYAPLFSRKQIDEEALERIYGYDKALTGLVKEIEDVIIAMTETGEIPSEEEVARVRKMLSDMERRIDQREAFLNTQPG
jgi:hypothetical protein